MPRIKAALALLVTAVFCIGFNAMRYPAVWEMLAASGTPSSESATKTAAASTSKKANDGLPVPAASITGPGSDVSKKNGATAKREEKSASRNAKTEKPSSAKGKSTENQKANKSPSKTGKGSGAAKAKKSETEDPESRSSKKSEATDDGHEQSSFAKTDSGNSYDSSSGYSYSGGDSYSYGATSGKKAGGSSSYEKKSDEADKGDCADGICKTPGSGGSETQSSTSGNEGTGSYGSSGPSEMSAEPRYGSPARSDPASPYDASAGGTTYGSGGTGGMVPVVRSPTSGTSTDWLSRSTKSPSTSADSRVTRLPPVEDTASSDADPYAAMGGGPMPIYPVTKPKN